MTYRFAATSAALLVATALLGCCREKRKKEAQEMKEQFLENVPVGAKLNARGDVVQLETSLELLSAIDPPTGLQSTLQVPLGQAVVLGGSTIATPNGNTPSLLFYIVRVRRLDQPKS